jgi:hypothetical protein
MPSPPVVGVFVFAVILLGTFAGWAIGKRLPEDHLSTDTRSVVSVSMAVVGTLSALVLGLLISNANTAFSERNREITVLSANILRLDQALRSYGPEADDARKLLQQYAERKTDDLFPEHQSNAVQTDDPATYRVLVRLENSVLALQPSDARGKWWLQQALTLAANMGNTRWLLVEQSGQGTPKAFLALVTFWLTLLFASFGLFAPRNSTSLIALALCALAVSGGVEMILEFENPFGGIVHLSPWAMRYASGALSQ